MTHFNFFSLPQFLHVYIGDNDAYALVTLFMFISLEFCKYPMIVKRKMNLCRATQMHT